MGASSQPSRTALRTVFSAHQDALAEKRAAARAVDQGRTAVAQAEAELSKLENLSFAASEDAANQILAAARLGKPQPVIPRDANATARNDAHARLDQAAQTLRTLLAKEAAATRHADRRTFYNLRKEGTELLSAAGDQLANELRANIEKAAILKSTVVGPGHVAHRPQRALPALVQRA